MNLIKDSYFKKNANDEFIFENSLNVYSKENKNKNSSMPRNTAYIPLDKSLNNKMIITESNINNSISKKLTNGKVNLKFTQEEKYININTSVNKNDNENAKNGLELENKIKRVNLPIPDKPRHRKNKSQAYEGNIPIDLSINNPTYNFTNFENVIRSTEQSYNPLNTLTTKRDTTTNKRISVVNEGTNKSYLFL